MFSPFVFIRSVATITASHVKAHKRLWLALAFGLFTPVTVLAALAFYQSALKEMGISVVKERTDPVDLGLQMVSHNRSIGKVDYDRINGFVEGTIDADLKTLVKEINRTGQTPPFVMLESGAPPVLRGDLNHAYVFYQTRIDEHVTVTSGRLPRPIRTPGFLLEVAVGERAALEAGVTIPQVFDLYPFATDPSQKITVNIVGLVRPKNLSEEYWMGHGEQFSSLTAGGDTSLVPMYIPEETFYGSVAGAFASLPVSYWWYVYTNTANLTSGNYQEARASMARLEVNLNQGQPRMLFFTNLPRVLDSYEQKLFFARIPVSVLSFLVAGIAFIYLVFVSSFLLSSLSPELALLRSRGASNLQLLSVFAFQGLALSLFAFALGIPLAALLVALLGLVSPFSIVSGSSLLWVGIPSSALWLGALGALVGFVAILVPAIRASSVTSVTSRSLASRPQPHFFSRFYLDVFVAVAAGLLYWQLSSSGSFVSSDLFSGRHEDKLLLAAPMLLILTGVLIFMRLFPIAVSLAVSISKPLAGVVPVLVLRRVSRDVSSYSVMVALIGLATGLGVFVASFGGTLNRSFSDRALYNIGSDMRLLGPQDQLERAERLREANLNLPIRSTNVYRDTGFISQGGSVSATTVMAVDPKRFADVAWYRSDFSKESLDSLMFSISAPYAKVPAKAMPGIPQFVGVWVLPQQNYGGLLVVMRLQDNQGDYFNLPLGLMEGKEWQFLQAELPPPSFESVPVYPFKFSSLFMVSVFGESSSNTGQVTFDDVSSKQFEHETWDTVESFDTASGIETMPTSEFLQDRIRVVNDGHTGPGLAFSWNARLRSYPRGILNHTVDFPIPVVVSPGFPGTNRPSETIRVMVGRRVVPMVIRGSVDFFPTLDPTRERFIITSRQKLQEFLDAIPGPPFESVNETWVAFDDGVDESFTASQVTEGLDQSIGVITLKQASSRLEADPLAAAGWSILPYAVYILALALLSMAIIVYSFTYLRKRRLEHAVLIAQGLSRSQIVKAHFIEATGISLIGGVLGFVWGTMVRKDLLGFIGINEAGDRVTPPYALMTDWYGLGILLAAFILVIASMAYVTATSLSNLSVQRELKSAE